MAALSIVSFFSQHPHPKIPADFNIDDYVGKTTGSVGLWLIRSNHEKASGGPFFRSLVRGSDSSKDDFYEIYFYSMGHTDPERYGLQGPTVLAFTDGEAPKNTLFARVADWGWFDTLGIDGWVPSSGRGYVSGLGKCYIIKTKSQIGMF